MIRIRARQQILIRRPAEEIFVYVSDLEHMTGWSSALVAIQKLTPEAVCPGTLVQSTLRMCDRQMEMIFEIVEYESGRYLAFKSITGSIPCFLCYQCEPMEEGGTTLTVEVTLQLIEDNLDLEESAANRALRRQIAYDLRTLKEMLEAWAELRAKGIE